MRHLRVPRAFSSPLGPLRGPRMGPRKGLPPGALPCLLLALILALAACAAPRAVPAGPTPATRGPAAADAAPGTPTALRVAQPTPAPVTPPTAAVGLPVTPALLPATEASAPGPAATAMPSAPAGAGGTPSPAAAPAASPTLAGPTPGHAPGFTPDAAPTAAPNEAPTAVPNAAPGTPPGQAPEATATPGSLALPPTPDLLIQRPLLIDEAGGRIYAHALFSPPGGGAADPRRPGVTAVFAAADGRLLATYDVAGPLALDAGRGRLYVDRGQDGLAVVDAGTGRLLRTIALPAPAENADGSSLPQADTSTGQVLAMRGHSLLLIDPASGQVARSVDFDVRPQDNCRMPHDAPLPIAGSHYDNQKRIVYLDFVTYACVPWIGLTIVSYDLNTGQELGRSGSYPYEAVAADGRHYGASRHRFGVGYVWAWRDGRPALETADWTANVGAPYPDARRGRLYVAAGAGLYVLAADDLRPLFVVPLPAAGSLAGFDAASDQLYFVDGGRLRTAPAAALHAPAPAAPVPAQPPASQVSLLAVSPDWARDHTLFGAWGYQIPSPDACYVFAQMGGALYLSQDGGQAWRRPAAGLPGPCTFVTALALSPAYDADHTAFAAVAGSGIFRSTDGGALWQPAAGGLPSMYATSLALSPGFAADQTIFATLNDRPLQRSTDGGGTWRSTGDLQARLAALSPEFDRDGTLAAYGRLAGGAESLQLSRDRGEHWTALAATPPVSGSLVLLSLAPAFSRWQVMFALDGQGQLFRSADAGHSWQAVLGAGSTGGLVAQLAYGPGEQNRPVFLLLRTDNGGEAGQLTGRLFRSGDGGQTWAEVQPGSGLVPTAMALSPQFDQDGLLFLGSADGRVVTVRGLELPAIK